MALRRLMTIDAFEYLPDDGQWYALWDRALRVMVPPGEPRSDVIRETAWIAKQFVHAAGG